MVDGPIIHEGRSALYKLGTMGLSIDSMREAVRRGEVARADATANDPINAAGHDAYRHRVRALRDIFGPVDWKRLEIHGLELLAKADGQTAIMTKGGDQGVGLASAHPQPNKEIREGAAATMNATLPLFKVEWLGAQDVPRPQREIWILLVYTSPVVVRSELSLGSEIDQRGRIARWFERIILPDIDPNDLRPKVSQPGPEPEADAIDVPVIRKKQA